MLAFERLPLRLGRSRLFISLRPDHGKPTAPFGIPVRNDDVYVEAQLSPAEAVKAALAACVQLDLPAQSLAGDDDDAGEAEEGPTTWHLNVGGRSLGDMLRFGFWEAGGGRRYRAIVERLAVGDRVYLYRNGAGYVAAGVVVGAEAERIEAFVENAGITVDETTQRYARRQVADILPASEDEAEYVRSIEWRWRRPDGAPVRLRDFIPGWIAPIIAGCRLRQPEVQTNLAREFGIDADQTTAAQEPA